MGYPAKSIAEQIRGSRERGQAGDDSPPLAAAGPGFVGRPMTCALLIFCAALPLVAAPPAPVPRLLEVKVYPPEVQLSSKPDFQSLVVQARYEDRTTRDATSRSEYRIQNEGIVKWDHGALRPIADGETRLIARLEGHEVSVPIKVVGVTNEPPVSFKLDVMPVFMKAGCNTGACHGSARGQDGFRLSLFGFDPNGDYLRLTRERAGRRLDLARPGASLLLAKATGRVTHTGGRLFGDDSELYDTLLRWIRAGAPEDPANIPAPVSLEVFPREIVMEGSGHPQQLVARVKYSDGTDRDVTGEAVFLSNNPPTASVSDRGRVLSASPGEAFVMARYATFTVGAQVIVVPKNSPRNLPVPPANNYIDTLINAKLGKLRICPSDACDDAVFLRRAFIDVIGGLPSRAEYDDFMADADPAKRERLIDALLARKEFVELWVMKWAELLQIRTVVNQFSYKSVVLYYSWLQDRLAKNVPIDQIVCELLGASGGTFTNPATNYYEIEKDKLKLAENCAQVFMGMRLQCAQCHNHPFDRWTMDDYYGFAAFFSQVGRKNAEDPRERIIFNAGGGKTEHPVTKKDVPPAFLGSGPANTEGKDRRVVLAEWLTKPDNPYFARNLANIIWAHFFGRGIVEPVDDVRISNPPSNPELLDALASKLVEYKFDFRRLIRDICGSRTYQLSTVPNDTNAHEERNFSKAAIRRIRAEVLLDCISEVTGTKDKFRGLPEGARAVQIADGNTSSYFLTTFGRATRESVCSCEVVMQPNLSQALHLLNGETTHQKIKKGGIVAGIAKEQSPALVIRELYLRCLQRPPTVEEEKDLLARVSAAPEAERQQILEDVFWALLNSKEFVFNH